MSCWRYGFGLLIVPSSASLVSVKKFGRLLLNSKGSLGSDTGLHPKPDESVARHTQFNSKIRFDIVLIYVQVFQLQFCVPIHLHCVCAVVVTVAWAFTLNNYFAQRVYLRVLFCFNSIYVSFDV
jgi:hypothetical protein